MRFPFKKIKFILADIDARYESINRGGCGVMAYILAKHLKDMVDDLRIVTCGGDGNVDEARNYTNFDNINDSIFDDLNIQFRHVWVEIKWHNKWYAVDSEGIRPVEDMYRMWGSPCPGSFTIGEMKRMSDNSDGWNWWFDRSDIPSMKVVAGRHFNKLKASLDYEYVWDYA